jgi:peptide/nickel transport system permease protein
MFRYIVRRILQMIPTVFGVILITFVLFNVVGGSPAAMTLGRHVTAKALEDFDEQRGFNKPLVFGWWARTRALPDFDADSGPGAWKGVEGAAVAETGSLLLRGSAEYALPLAFPLRAGTAYRLTLEGRSPDGGEAAVVTAPSPGGSRSPNATVLPFSKAWKKTVLDFQGLENGDPAVPLLAVRSGSIEIRSAALRRRMPHPFDSQFLFYLGQIARLDFGVSSSLNLPVSQLLLAGMPASLLLMVPIFFAELIVSVGIALVCAFFRNTWIDRAFVVLAVALMSINYVVWIIGGQYLLGFKLGWFPVWGFASWHYLLLPVIVGLVSGIGSNVRFYRTIMLDEMYKDYVRTAFAKGVGRSGVLFRHVLKNAMIPIVTNTVIAIPFLYTGSLLLESFFGIPGLGYLGVNAINSSDVDVVRAEVFIGSVLFVVFNLVTDLCYAGLDPRVKLA